MAEDSRAEADLTFGRALPLSDDKAAALEDYARVVARAEAAFVLRAGPGDEEAVTGVRLRRPEALTPDVAGDIEGFASSLVQGGSGLGWS